MFTAVLIGAGLVLATGLVHFLLLVPGVRCVRATRWRPLARDMTVLVAVVVAHCAEAGLYAAGFALGQALGLGAFAQVQAMSWMDYFYFSLVNYNTLGLGDIHPTGHLRFIAGPRCQGSCRSEPSGSSTSQTGGAARSLPLAG